MTREGFVVATGVLLVLLHLTGFLFEDTKNGECRPGFVRVDQWCFSFHTEPTPMLQSSDACHQYGAHMAVLDSQEKEKALTDYIEQPTPMLQSSDACHQYGAHIAVLDSQEKEKALTDYIEQMGFFDIYQERKELYKIAQHEWDVQTEKIYFVRTLSYMVYTVKNTATYLMQRANLSTPPGFSIKLSNIPGAGLGAWADEFVPQYTILGVYEGVIHTRESDSDLYSWQVDRQGSNGTYVIDAADPACSNWLRFVNSPTTHKEENVIPVPCAGIVFYMTSRDVDPGTELLVWYGDGYGRFLGVNRIHPEYDLNGSVALRANVITYIDDKGLVFDDWTPVTYQNWFDNDDDESETVLEQIFGLLLTYHHDNKWYWVAERNYTYYTGHEGLKLPFICEDSSLNDSGVG